VKKRSATEFNGVVSMTNSRKKSEKGCQKQVGDLAAKTRLGSSTITREGEGRGGAKPLDQEFLAKD